MRKWEKFKNIESWQYVAGKLQLSVWKDMEGYHFSAGDPFYCGSAKSLSQAKSLAIKTAIKAIHDQCEDFRETLRLLDDKDSPFCKQCNVEY